MFYGVIVDPSKKDPVAYVPSPDGDMLLYVHVACFPVARQATPSPAPSLTRPSRVSPATFHTCCLDPQKAKKNSGVKATLMVKSGGDEHAYAVCALREGGTESVAVDLAMEEYAEFTVVGNCPIHLTGYYMPLDDDEEDEEGLMPGYGDDGDSDDFDMDFDDDPALLGYDASGLPIYDGEGDTDDDDEGDEDDEDDSDDSVSDDSVSDDSDGPRGGNVLEIKDVTDGASDEDSSGSEEDEDSEDGSGESDEEEAEPVPAPAQKKQKPEPKTQQKPEPKTQQKPEPKTQQKPAAAAAKKEGTRIGDEDQSQEVSKRV